MKRKSLAMVAAAAVVVTGMMVTMPGVASANPAVLYVAAVFGSNGGNSCQSSSHPFATIDYALSVAESGATIKLQAGTYNEQVAITKPVTIKGVSSTQSIIQPSAVPLSDTDTDGVQPQYYVVDVKNTTGVTLQNVGVSGSAATPTFAPNDCAQDFVGVYYHDASGTLKSDAVTGIELPSTDFGCQGGLGVYAATDSTSAIKSTVTMTSDVVNTYDKNGITCDDPGTSCTITGSTITGIGSTPLIAQNGIQIWASAATLTNNTISGNTYNGPTYAASGILVGNPYTLSLTKNKVTSNDSDVYVLQDQGPGWVYCGNTSTSCTNLAASGTTFTFSKNTVSNATNVYSSPPNPVGSGFGDGLDLDSLTQSTSVTQNTANSDPGNGISLYGAVGTVLVKNTLSGDGNGIYLGSGTASNNAVYNSVQTNSVSDPPSTGSWPTSRPSPTCSRPTPAGRVPASTSATTRTAAAPRAQPTPGRTTSARQARRPASASPEGEASRRAPSGSLTRRATTRRQRRARSHSCLLPPWAGRSPDPSRVVGSARSASEGNW